MNPEIWAPLKDPPINAAERKPGLRMANLQQDRQKATFSTVMATEKLLGIKNYPKTHRNSTRGIQSMEIDDRKTNRSIDINR